MAHLEQHVKDCEHFLGAGHEEVHKWLDQYMAALGAAHRRELHHWEGIDQAERRFGREAGKAAIVHILRDCRNIPRRADYDTSKADPLGLRTDWPIAAYALYTEEAFRLLVRYQLWGPEGSFLWSFVGESDMQQLWNNIVADREPPSVLNVDAWQSAQAAAAKLAPLAALGEEDICVFDPEDRSTLENFAQGNQPFRAALTIMAATGLNPIFCWLPANKLVSSIGVIDYELIERLRAEITGVDKASLIQFAFFSDTPTKFRGEQSGKSVTVTSAELAAITSQPRLGQDDDGMFYVRFDLGRQAQFIHVVSDGRRAFVANGMHRCHLLMAMGVTRIPALMINVPGIPSLTSTYPVFAPQVLLSQRPPLIGDFFNEALATQLPLQRKQRVIRITAEEFVVPQM